MKISPLQLDQHYLVSVHLDAHLDATVKGKVELDVQSKVELATHAEDPRRWRVDLTVSFHAKDKTNSPYTGRVTFVGFFTVDQAYPEEKVKLLVETNGPSMLFGAVREMVANLTARGPWSMLSLPTQSFYKAPKPAPPAAKGVES